MSEMLGDVKVSKPLIIKAYSFSKSAVEKIEVSGGEAVVTSTK